MNGKVILLISPESWESNFVSKHHYANYLSKHNTVYFLNPVTNTIVNPFGSVNVAINSIKENLILVNYQNLLPKLNNLPKFIQNYIYKKQALQIQKALNIDEFDIVWSFDPYRFWNQNVWSSNKTIYHIVDFHPSACFELNMLKSSSLCLSVSKHIQTSLMVERYNVEIISHGYSVDSNYFTDVVVPGENSLKAVYVGNVQRLLDKVRLNELAILNPEIDFILIGPKSENIKDNQFEKNVYPIGKKAPETIESYLRYCNINLLLLVNRKEIKNVNSHKLMHYFYSGNVTLSDWLLDYEDETILDMAKTPDDFNRMFKVIITNLEVYNSEDLKSKRRQFAIDNSYDKKIQEISKLLYKND